MPLDPVEILRDLVSLASVNPMGRAPLAGGGPEPGEHLVTEYLERLFGRLSLACQRQSVHPGRDNIVARLDGDVPLGAGGELFLLAVHQDTVPVEGMTVDPFRAEIRDGRLYGRGACDVKGAMAAMLAALSRLAEERPRGMPTVLLACTVNEEYGFSGARALAEWFRAPSGIVPRRPDAAVVAEPTDLDVVVAHKGVVRWKCHTLGRAAHSSRPETGDNAIYKMARVLTALERYQREIVGGLAQHPGCGPATLSVGTIHGGISVNVVPDRATIEIDRRLPPGEDAAAAYRHFTGYLAAAPGIDFPVEHETPYMYGPPLSDAPNHGLAARVQSSAASLGISSRAVAVPYATDAALIALAGVPSVVFGPGSIAQAHTKDEWIDLNELRRGTELYYRIISP